MRRPRGHVTQRPRQPARGHRTIESIELYCSRCRPHEPIGDRVPAEAIQEFFDRFERALAYDPEAMEAA